MNTLQQAAHRKGWLIYAMSQANTPAMTEQGPWGHTGAGYCAGLSVRWTALRYGGFDYPFDAQTRESTNPDWQATRDFNVYLDVFNKPGGGAFPDDFKAAYAQYGLRLNQGSVTKLSMPMNGTFLHSACAAKAGCYFVALFGPAAGHAVAVHNTGNMGWRFFDPNFGCFLLTDAADFQGFVDWFMKNSGYLRNNFLASNFNVVGIDPPPFTGAAFQEVMKKLVERLGR